VVRHDARFPPPQRTTYHDHWELLAVLAGSGSLRGPEIDLRERLICLIPPGVPHQETSERNVDVIWMGIQGSRLLGLDREVAATVASGEIAGMMERLWLFAQMNSGGIGPELDALAALILFRFLRLLSGGSVVTTDRVERAIRLFHERMAEPLYMPEIASQLGCSLSCFTREFRRRTGRTPAAYLTNLRTQHAARLLETTSLPAREIAELTGFPDAFYFSRVFKRVVGKSPARWRAGLH